MNDIEIYRKENIHIFLQKIEDNRCPIGMQCIWDGNAVVHMRITDGSNTELFHLNTYDSPTKINIFGLNIELFSLKPQPLERGIAYPLERYSIDLRIS